MLASLSRQSWDDRTGGELGCADDDGRCGGTELELSRGEERWGDWELTFFFARSPLAPRTTMRVLDSSECSVSPPLDGMSLVASEEDMAGGGGAVARTRKDGRLTELVERREGAKVWEEAKPATAVNSLVRSLRLGITNFKSKPKLRGKQLSFFTSGPPEGREDLYPIESSSKTGKHLRLETGVGNGVA